MMVYKELRDVDTLKKRISFVSRRTSIPKPMRKGEIPVFLDLHEESVALDNSSIETPIRYENS